jgi:hypothetical protein
MKRLRLSCDQPNHNLGVKEYQSASSTLAQSEQWARDALFGTGLNITTVIGTYDPFRAATEANATNLAREQAVSYQKVALELSNIMDVGSMFLQNLKAQVFRNPQPSACVKTTALA